MKKKLMNNAGLKIIALVSAILLWLLVVNISDPTITQTFSGVDVTVTNADIITNNGKTYDISEEQRKVSVTVTAKRSIIESINNNKIHAEASMKNLMDGNLIPVEVYVDGYEDYKAEVNPVNIQVSIEDTASNKFPVTVVTSGEVQDGYVIGNTTAKPSAITISGAKSVITSISKVVVKVDVSGLSGDKTLNGELLIYGANENVLDQTQLTTNIGTGGARVKVDLYSTKNVKLNFSTRGNPEAGYVCSGISCEPEEILAAGEEDAISALETIDIPARALDISGANSTVEKTIDITEYLPEGILLVDDTTRNVVVTAAIEKLGTKTITIPAGAVVINNAPPELTASFKSANDLELNFTGSGNVLENLTESQISASVDLSGLKEKGSYEVPLKVEAPSGCALSEDIKVTVILIKE